MNFKTFLEQVDMLKRFCTHLEDTPIVICVDDSILIEIKGFGDGYSPQLVKRYSPITIHGKMKSGRMDHRICQSNHPALRMAFRFLDLVALNLHKMVSLIRIHDKNHLDAWKTGVHEQVD